MTDLDHATADMTPAGPSSGPDPAEGPARRRLRRPTSPGGWAMAVIAGVTAVLLVGNGLIIGAHLTALVLGPDDDLALAGIPRARAVDADLWRGRAPTDEGYRSLADRGVQVVVDLRAEEFQVAPQDLLDELDLTLVRIPIRDGQTPTAGQVEQLLDVVRRGPGPVFMHCGAGVGRTGAMAAAYSVSTADTANGALLWENLSIGPPSLEQIVYAATIDDVGPVEQPPTWVKGISRLFDGPRRIWHNLRGDV